MRGPLSIPISTHGLTDLLVDTDCMCLWECLRRVRRATAGKLANLVARPRELVQRDLERMHVVGLVVRGSSASERGSIAWSVAGEPIVVTCPDDDAYSASIDRIREHHRRQYENAVLPSGIEEEDPAASLRLDERRLAHLAPEDLHELRRRMRAVLDYLELVASRRSGPKSTRLDCNHAISIEVRPMSGPALPLPSRIQLHGPNHASHADANASPAEAPAARTARGMPHKRTLSPRELQVAQAMAGGLTRKELAQALGLSTNTIGTMLKRVYAKLGVNRRAQLAQVMAAMPQHEGL